MSEQPKAGVLGDPVAHSRSPLIHNFWLTEYGLQGSYEKLHITADAFAPFVRSLASRGYVGANVTLPHKEAAFALADELDPWAARLKAVNTLVFEGGRIKGFNTDGYGFMQNLTSEAPQWHRDRPVLVLGAGGAARAIVASLAAAGVPEIYMANRTVEKIESFRPLITDTDCRLRALSWPERQTPLAEIGLLVNTTSLGMAEKSMTEKDKALDIALDDMASDAVVTDIVYTPLITPLLRAARARELHIVDGLGMLLHQAAPGFAHWFGRQPEVTTALRQHVEADLQGDA